jgi:Lrp/AsnC family transcriptional regulator for asnA, asnC and gidA
MLKRGRRPKLLDDMDRSILSVLHENSITPFVKIADMLNVNEGTIRHRVKRLMRYGIIKRFTVALDPIALGLGSIMMLLLSVNSDRLRSVAESVSKMPNVLEVFEVHTYGDLLLKLRGRSISELNEIVDRIKCIDGVTDAKVISVTNVWKDEQLRPT